MERMPSGSHTVDHTESLLDPAIILILSLIIINYSYIIINSTGSCFHLEKQFKNAADSLVLLEHLWHQFYQSNIVN